ncbi:hypothetical protein [Calothrix sp. NIES-3974]|nr:hypothetical protein [Calothrix sp. NIES-3974]
MSCPYSRHPTLTLQTFSADPNYILVRMRDRKFWKADCYCL